MIGILSDTHENVEGIKAAVAILKERKPELVIHCGDIISPLVLDYFKGLPMLFCFGNNDGEQEFLKQRIAELGFRGIDFEHVLEIDGKRIFACHGHRKGLMNQALETFKYDYLLHGHTHVLQDEKIGRTRVINVGCFFKPLGEQHFYSFGMLDPKTDKLELIKLDMETYKVLND